MIIKNIFYLLKDTFIKIPLIQQRLQHILASKSYSNHTKVHKTLSLTSYMLLPLSSRTSLKPRTIIKLFNEHSLNGNNLCEVLVLITAQKELKAFILKSLHYDRTDGSAQRIQF